LAEKGKQNFFFGDAHYQDLNNVGTGQKKGNPTPYLSRRNRVEAKKMVEINLKNVLEKDRCEVSQTLP